jgi:hypothetical protein
VTYAAYDVHARMQYASVPLAAAMDEVNLQP